MTERLNYFRVWLIAALALTTNSPAMLSANPLPGTRAGARSIPGNARAGIARPMTATACPCYQVLYTFSGDTDSNRPQAPLALYDGLLYGTAQNGGPGGEGTVFSVAPNGAETILHGFGLQKNDGQQPENGSLVVVNTSGEMYGMTANGGAKGAGTVFKVDPSGNEIVVHNFGSYDTDGSLPFGGLIDVNGLLYGVTSAGGNGDGVVFSIAKDGTEKVIHIFTGSDGANPFATLIYLDGALYGTTSAGGKFNRGTVFKVALDGSLKVLHSFGGGTDGKRPLAGLVAIGSTLFGTTTEGGTRGGGTVFKLDQAGVKTVLYNFGAPGTQGGYPSAAALVVVGGSLYGTTLGSKTGKTNLAGTIYGMTPAGTESTLYQFKAGGGGSSPDGGLTVVNGVLYGTTAAGGSPAPSDYGTVYSLTL